MGEFQDAIEESVGKKWAKVGGFVAVLAAIYLIASLVFGMWPFSVAAGVAKKVINSEAIISNYQWYYDQYNAIKAQAANYESMDKEATERNGLQMVLNSMIGEYNSRSRQVTRNLWKANDLPYSIDLIGGTK